MSFDAYASKTKYDLRGSRGVHALWPKIGNFFFLLFTEKGRMTVFSDLLDRKLAILYYKNIDLKNSKVLHFFSVVSPWFLVKKWKFCPIVFFSKIGQKKVFSDPLDRKLAILYYKDIDLKKSKVLHFFKVPGLVHGFWAKNGVLFSFSPK